MNSKLKATRIRFVFTTVLLAAGSVLMLAAILYEANVITFNNEIDSKDLHEAIAEHEDVASYLESEQQNEAHFLTIANSLQDNQQSESSRIIILALLPTVGAVAVIGYFVARRLLKPVEEAHEAQERFLGDAAHELRNPLATMYAITQNTTDTQTKKQYEEATIQMKRQIKRMVRINEDLLYLERTIDNEAASETNISELLRDVVEDLQHHANARNIKFKLNIDDGITRSIPSKDFVRLAKNLIENAIKYSRPQSKTVTITLTESKGHAELQVADTGIGIPAEDLANITERFFRASNVGNKPGSGLGLAIVQKIAQNNGGSVEITSEENKGTTVAVAL